MFEGNFTGGCQCGAVRFRATKLGRPSICHCRMCQKQFGSFFGAFISTDPAHLQWTRGQPTLFRSSNIVFRGFCDACGTPLTYKHRDGIEIAIGALDNPEQFQPQVQVNHHLRLPWIDELFDAPAKSQTVDETTIISYQHPDHDTETWPAKDDFQ